MSWMVYAVVRRQYGHYGDKDAETLVRMFATFREAEEYISDRVVVFRPTKVYDGDICSYEYGMPDSDTTVSRAEFPQYAIRPFYIEGDE